MDKGKNNQKRPAGTGRTKITLHIGGKSFTGYIDQVDREDSLQSTDKVDEQKEGEDFLSDKIQVIFIQTDETNPKDVAIITKDYVNTDGLCSRIKYGDYKPNKPYLGDYVDRIIIQTDDKEIKIASITDTLNPEKGYKIHAVFTD